MRSDTRQGLPAGDFSTWLRHSRSALLTGVGTSVECGECTACCSSSLFVHIGPEETQTLARIHKDILVAAPGLPKDHVLLGYDKNGCCPMLIDGRCSIYEHRPQTCRTYDCRVFAAAGIPAGGCDTARITQRVKRWKFGYPSRRDCDEHLAVQAAAKFIRDHAECFPGGETPSDPSQLAILAIKVYDVFLEKDGGSAGAGGASTDAEVAKAVVEACREFDATAPALVPQSDNVAVDQVSGMDKMRIAYLVDHPEATPVLAAWFAGEWGGLNPQSTVAGFSAGLSPQASRDQLPICLIGLIDGEPVATATLKFREIEYSEAADFWLGWVFVREDMRGRGHGRTIVAAAEAEAVTRHFTPLFLHTPGKAAMYSHLGWQAVGRTTADGLQTTVMTKYAEQRHAPDGA